MQTPDEIFVIAEGSANVWQGAWPDRICTQVTRPELHLYRAQGTARARAVVYAGGGYVQLMHDKEGVEVAHWLNAQGIDAYVLLHRLPGQADGCGGVWRFDIALQDGLLALKQLATLAPLPLLHVGLSSGGHLAGVMACQIQAEHAEQDAQGAQGAQGAQAVQGCGVVIAYAPINANHRDHKAPAGKPDYPPPQKQAFYDAWPIGLAQHPHGMPRMPVFLAYALHDAVVPVDHALNLIRGVQQSGGQVDAHIFAGAPHGFALRELQGTHAQWPALAQRWISGLLQR